MSVNGHKLYGELRGIQKRRDGSYICSGCTGTFIDYVAWATHDCPHDVATAVGILEKPADKAPAGDPAQAQKKDVGKAPIWQGFLAYFPRAVFAVAMVSEYGYRKYGSWGGWALVPSGLERYMDADARHWLKLPIEGSYDAESGLAHLAQKAWNAMAELERAIKDQGLEIRRGNDIVDGKPVANTATVATL